VRFNEHLEAEGPLVFEHACRMGLEGIVSKRKSSRYQSGRSRDWVKAKNPEAPAVTRLADEDWVRSWSSSSGRRPSGPVTMGQSGRRLPTCYCISGRCRHTSAQFQSALCSSTPPLPWAGLL
jgi:hypothetical protein